LTDVRELVAVFKEMVDFLTIYILEAHAEDTWPLGGDVRYLQTHTLEARAKVARDFISQNSYELPVRIDEAPSNKFNSVFAAWPLRYYLLSPSGEILYIHEPEGPLVLIKTLHRWLQGYFNVL
jgi:hypothetical protein